MADVLKQIATLLELKGENPFKLSVWSTPRTRQSFKRWSALVGEAQQSIASVRGDKILFKLGAELCRICLAYQQFCRVNKRCMTQNRRHALDDRQLPGTGTAYRSRGWSPCLFALLVFAALMCSSCQTPLPPLPNPPGPKTAVRLVPGDVIKVSYSEESVPDQTQKIRRDGKVSLPLIGQVTAAGKRPIDFQDELVSLYEGKLENNEVLVTLESGVATVIVSGFANKPGTYSFDRPTTVYQAIMEAGGVSDYGSPSNVRLSRIINGVQLTESINLRPTIRGEPTRPKYVQDGDVIYISRSLF
jgi:polysaccharide biosynthesis/export protein